MGRANSDAIIIHVGTNVSVKKRASDIADSIISVGKKCQDTGVRNVMISSLVHRKSPRLQAKIKEVNDVLRDLCTIDGFVFIDIKNLSNCDICKDLLHLSYSGTCKVVFDKAVLAAQNMNLLSTSEKSLEKKAVFKCQ